MLSAEFFPKILNANVVNNILLKIQQITTPQVQAITYAELHIQLQGQDITNLHIFSKMLELKLELDQDHLDEEIVMFIVPILIYQLDKQLSQNIALSTINCLLYIIGDGSQFADILQAYQIHSKLFQILSKRVITSQILIGQILLLLNYVSDSIYYRQQTIMNDYLYYSIQYLEGESQETQDNAGIIFWSIKSMISTNYEHLPQLYGFMKPQLIQKFRYCLPFFIKYLEKLEKQENQNTIFGLYDCLEIIIIIANTSIQLITDLNQSIIKKLILMITQFAKNNLEDNYAQLLSFKLIQNLADIDYILDMIINQGFLTGLTITWMKRAKLSTILQVLLKISGKVSNSGKLFMENALIEQLFQIAFEFPLQIQQLILLIIINLLKQNEYEMDIHIYKLGLQKIINQIFNYGQTEQYNIGLQIILLLLKKYAQNKEQYGFVEKTLKQHRIFDCITLLQTIGQNEENNALIKQIQQIK